MLHQAGVLDRDWRRRRDQEETYWGGILGSGEWRNGAVEEWRFDGWSFNRGTVLMKFQRGLTEQSFAKV